MMKQFLCGSREGVIWVTHQAAHISFSEGQAALMRADGSPDPMGLEARIC